MLKIPRDQWKTLIKEYCIKDVKRHLRNAKKRYLEHILGNA